MFNRKIHHASKREKIYNCFTVVQNEAYNFILMEHFTVAGENKVGVYLVLV